MGKTMCRPLKAMRDATSCIHLCCVDRLTQVGLVRHQKPTATLALILSTGTFLPRSSGLKRLPTGHRRSVYDVRRHEVYSIPELKQAPRSINTYRTAFLTTLSRHRILSLTLVRDLDTYHRLES